MNEVEFTSGRSMTRQPNAMAETNHIRTEIACTREDLQPLAPEWKQLALVHGTPLLDFEWFDACAAAFCPPGRLNVSVVRSDTSLLAVAPLVRLRRLGMEWLELLGTAVHREPSGFLYRDETALRKLIEAVFALGLPMRFNKIRSDSCEGRLLLSKGRETIVPIFSPHSRSPWIPIRCSWEEYERGISSRRRSDFRRACRKAEGSGKVDVQIASPCPEEVPLLLEEVFRVEAAGWKQRVGTAMKSYRPLNDFFRHYCRAAASLGILRICVLRINGAGVAVQLAVEYARRFWVLKIGYDERWSFCSPGVLLMHEVIRYAFQRGLQALEFLGTDEPWLRVWTSHLHQYESVHIYPRNVRGLFWFGAEAPRYLARQVLVGR